MGNISPGGKSIIADAFKKANLINGCDVLDIGCGDGSTLACLKDEYEINAVGIDKSSALIKQGQEKYKNIDLQEGEADFLDFPSLSFDAVVMECILSVIEMKVEALHEAYCLLRNGGKLIVTDLFGDDEGMLNKETIIKECEEMGFTTLEIEDKKEELATFTAEKIMEYGSISAYFEAITPEGDDKESFCKIAEESKNVKYLLLIFEKRKL